MFRRMGWTAVVLAACSSDPETPSGPDPSLRNESRTRDQVHEDVSFLSEKVTQYRTEDRLANLDIRALAFEGSTLYVGTAGGLYRAQGDTFEPVSGVGAVVDLTARAAGGLWVVGPGDVRSVSEGVAGTTLTSSTGVAWVAVAEAGGKLWAATSTALFEEVEGQLTFRPELTGREIRDMVGGADLVLATSTGLLRFTPGSGSVEPVSGVVDDDVRALAVDGTTIWAASRTGLSRICTGSPCTPEVLRAEKGGLPYDDLISVAARDGAVFSGHAIGATARAADGKRDYYHSGRWIPGEKVQAVALGPDGTRWMGTDQGLSKVSFEPMTLAEKAEILETALDKHWRMDGFLDEGLWYADPWDHDATPETDDNDNDGLWTEMQIGTWCFAYAATGEERYYNQARKAMDVMLMQFDIPALTFEAAGKKGGFITRSLVRDDEGEVFTSKATQANWHLQSFEGRQYYWKDDTSSDEYAGHFWGIPLFYDLCAKTDQERAEIEVRVRAAMDYIIDGGYNLLDLDGERTTHGIWSKLAIAADTVDGCPEKHSLVDCVFSWGGGGWLNSLEILGHLLATWHITKDPKYYEEYERLYTQERYGDMIPIKETTVTVTDPAFENHSDHELAMLAYFTLLRYEPNADRRERVIESVRSLLSHELDERNPWHLATAASTYAGELPLGPAIQTLQEISVDHREWVVDNTHRKDAKRVVNDRHGHFQLDTVFPYDELRTMKWNSSPYQADGGGNPRSVQYPTPWLISYWMMRYYGLIRG